MLREIGAQLITIHGQHDNQSLMNPAKHLEILDSYAQLEEKREEYRRCYRNLVDLEKQIARSRLTRGKNSVGWICCDIK